MSVYEAEQQFMCEKTIGFVYTCVIPTSLDSIAIVDGVKRHSVVATEAGFCAENEQFPPVFDGFRISYTLRLGWLILADVTDTTSPTGLRGLKRDTTAYNDAFTTMRRKSAQRVANLFSEKITAEFPDDSSESFFPENRQQ